LCAAAPAPAWLVGLRDPAAPRACGCLSGQLRGLRVGFALADRLGGRRVLLRAGCLRSAVSRAISRLGAGSCGSGLRGCVSWRADLSRFGGVSCRSGGGHRSSRRALRALGRCHVPPAAHAAGGGRRALARWRGGGHPSAPPAGLRACGWLPPGLLPGGVSQGAPGSTRKQGEPGGSQWPGGESPTLGEIPGQQNEVNKKEMRQEIEKT
jgi:hypothetical protein